MSYVTRNNNKIISPIINGGVFAPIVIGGLLLPLAFDFHEEGVKRPFWIALIIYSGTATIVYFRLQRPVSPSCEHDSEVFKTHFDNSWRLFQKMLSLMVALVAGVIFPLGTVLVKRQNIILEPLVWYIGALLLGFGLLALQLYVEIDILEKALTDNL